MSNYRLLYILFFIGVFGFAQSPLVLASQQQAGTTTNLYDGTDAASPDNESNSLGNWTAAQLSPSVTTSNVTDGTYAILVPGGAFTNPSIRLVTGNIFDGSSDYTISMDVTIIAGANAKFYLWSAEATNPLGSQSVASGSTTVTFNWSSDALAVGLRGYFINSNSTGESFTIDNVRITKD